MKLSQCFEFFLGLRIKLCLKPFDASLEVLFDVALMIFDDGFTIVFQLINQLMLCFINLFAVFFDILNSELL